MSDLARTLDLLAADAPLDRLEWSDVRARARRHRGTSGRRRRLTLGVAAAVVLAAGGTAVADGLDLLAQQEAFHATVPDDPARIGPLVEITSGEKWSLIAWRSSVGVCLDFAVPGNAAFGCGFPVRGAKPAGDTSGSGPPVHAVAGTLSGGGLVGGDAKSTVFGVAAQEVAAVQVELRDGRLVDAALYDAPRELAAPVKFFVLRLDLPSTGWREPAPVTAFLAYDRRGALIERFPL